VVFLGDYFHLFDKDNQSDFQVQCDSKEVPWIRKNSSIQWSINLGFYQVFPTESIPKLIPIWFNKMYLESKNNDQKTLKSLIRKLPSKWTTDVSFRVDTSKLLGKNTSISVRFLDPMLAVNPGGLFQEVSDLWKKESKIRNISTLILCHFFHLGSNKLKSLHMKQIHWWFLKNNKCLNRYPNRMKLW
jgi:hypothetical protein